jgi:site-specific recombinase XerD
MTSLAPTLEAYFTDRLIRQRRVSPHTVASYRDTFRLLLAYIKRTTGKERVAPLSKPTVAVLRAWLRETIDQPGSPLFPSRDGGTLTRDAIERRLAQHVKTAQHVCVSLRSKRVTMHTLRHTAAMNLLTAGVDTSTIALWLGHEQERTTHIYLHADLELKQRTLDRMTPPEGHPGRYQAPDTLLAFLESL